MMLPKETDLVLELLGWSYIPRMAVMNADDNRRVSEATIVARVMLKAANDFLYPPKAEDTSEVQS